MVTVDCDRSHKVWGLFLEYLSQKKSLNFIWIIPCRILNKIHIHPPITWSRFWGCGADPGWHMIQSRRTPWADASPSQGTHAVAAVGEIQGTQSKPARHGRFSTISVGLTHIYAL